MISEDFAAHAAKVKVSFKKEMSPDELKGCVEGLMHNIAADCVNEGTRLIGHIKCIAEIEPNKFIACSVVSHDAKPRCSGGFGEPSRKLDMVINVLQYGLGKESLEIIVEKESLKGFGPDAVVSIEDLSGEHDHEHNHPIRIDMG